jgi:hypothetical protein
MISAFIYVLIKSKGFNNIKSKLERSKSTIATYFWQCICAFFEYIYFQKVCGLSEKQSTHCHVTYNPTFR